MYSIGKKIKELRHKNDMTQERLADFLCVSYQAVSKWENGLSNPDLSLIASIARLFHVTADELLGLDSALENARFGELRTEYKKQADLLEYGEALRVAETAVAEFPGNYECLLWLADSEFHCAFDDDYCNGVSTDFFRNMMEKSRGHYEMIIDGCKDEKLRLSALNGIVFDLDCLGRPEEGIPYAEQYPETVLYTRDDVLCNILKGDELKAHKQQMVEKYTRKLLILLYDFLVDSNLGDYTETRAAAWRAMKSITEAVIPDGNYLDYHWWLYNAASCRAREEIAVGKHDGAMEALRCALEHAKGEVKLEKSAGAAYRYTSPLLEGAETRVMKAHPMYNTLSIFCCELEESLYDPLREREDFRALIAEAKVFLKEHGKA